MGVVVQRARICFRLRISLAADPARGPSRGVSAFRAVALLTRTMDGVGGCQAYVGDWMAARPRARITRSLWRVRYRCCCIASPRFPFFRTVEKNYTRVYPHTNLAEIGVGVYNEKRDTVRPIPDCRVFTGLVCSDVRCPDSCLYFTTMKKLASSFQLPASSRYRRLLDFPGSSQLAAGTSSPGFTLVELVVVTAIIVVVSSVVLVNNNRFGGVIQLENLAYDVALSV